MVDIQNQNIVGDYTKTVRVAYTTVAMKYKCIARIFKYNLKQI